MTRYASAFHGRQPDAAWALLSSRCQAVTSRADFAAAVTQASADFGDKPVTVSKVTSTIVGDRAFASYTVTGNGSSFSPTDLPWVREGGGWRMDGCS